MKKEMIEWLGTVVHSNVLIFDILDSQFRTIKRYLESKKMKFHSNTSEDVFFMRYIHFVYLNSAEQ
jgi:hypothetical protein